MDSSDSTTDKALLQGLGTRLEAHRLRRGLTQAQLAREAGVSKSTVERLEAGAGAQATNLVRVLRALHLLDGFLQLAPELPASPMEQLRGKRPLRRRASRQGPVPEPGPWSWGDER